MDIEHSRASRDERETINELKSTKRKNVKLGTYIILAALCLGATFLLKLDQFGWMGKHRTTVNNVFFAGAVSFGVLVLSRIIQTQVARRSHDKGLLYNFVQFIRLITLLVIVFVFVSFLNSNWYSAAASLGIISLLLGFALQTPIASLIGWFYILLRVPFKVGNRIQVGSFTGDVVEISYLDTTLWEFAGNFITSDLPSGRLIRFPNSMVFQNQIYNYSWQKFPYIWNEASFYITFNSDLEWVEKKVREVTLAQLDPETKEHVQDMRDVIKATPVDEIDIKEYPFVDYRIHPNNWVEVVLIYLVNPKKSSHMRSKIVKSVVAALLEEPERVSFAAEGS